MLPKKMIEKVFIFNDEAKNDPVIQDVAKKYLSDILREEQQNKDIREGRITPVPSTGWNISDRH